MPMRRATETFSLVLFLRWLTLNICPRSVLFMIKKFINRVLMSLS